MAAMSQERRNVRSRIALLTRNGGSAEDLLEARRELAALKIADTIREVMAAGPELTRAQKVRLVKLLGVPQGRRQPGNVPMVCEIFSIDELWLLDDSSEEAFNRSADVLSQAMYRTYQAGYRDALRPNETEVSRA